MIHGAEPKKRKTITNSSRDKKTGGITVRYPVDPFAPCVKGKTAIFEKKLDFMSSVIFADNLKKQPDLDILKLIGKC